MNRVTGRSYAKGGSSIAALIAVGAILGLTLATALSPVAGASGVGAVRAFPMWRLLPTDDFATLMDRTWGGFRAGVYVYRRGAGPGDPVVCIQQTNVRQRENASLSVSTGSPECSRLYPDRGFNATVGSFEASDRTVFGLVTGQQAAARVEIDLDPGEPVSVTTRVLGDKQARKARLPRLRFAALAVPRAACLKSIAAYSESGSVLFGTPDRGCAI